LPASSIGSFMRVPSPSCSSMTPGSWGRTPSTPTETRWLYLVPKLRSTTPQRAKESRGIGRYGCASRGNGQRAGRANPKSERPG
jgi:hypothetical protein